MNREQIRWAMQHDWFVAVLETKDGVLVRDYEEAGNQVFKAFKSFKELKAWAGY